MSYATRWDYHNKTPNKDERDASDASVEFCVLHETAGGGSLGYLMNPKVRASYTHIITRDGTLWPYLDVDKYIAWHAGIRSRWTTGGVLFTGYGVNVASYGVSCEGPNKKGFPITDAQMATLVQFLAELSIKHDWPLEQEYFPTHYEVAPGYKTDPLGYRVWEVRLKALVYKRFLLDQQAPVRQSWIVVAAANIRQGPNIMSEVAGILPVGFSFGSSEMVRGQSLNGNDQWAHLEDGRGFVHSSLVRAKQEPYILPVPLGVFAFPRIRENTWRRILEEAGSPILRENRDLYAMILNWGIDPAVALAFVADTKYGTDGIRSPARNWGCVVHPFDKMRANGFFYTPNGTIASYSSWEAGLEDWCERIARRYRDTMGLDTLEAILPVYQPNVKEAIVTKRQRVEGYIKLDRGE